MTKKTYTIGQLAKTAGVGVETIRYYQRRHLLAIPERDFGSIRNYPVEFVERLQFIKKAKELGFSLDEIGSLLMLNTKNRQLGINHSDEQRRGLKGADSINSSVRQIAYERLIQVRQKIAELKKIELSLDQLITQCEHVNAAAPCPIVGALACKISS